MVEEKENDIIEKAHIAAERLEQANRIKKELLDREEELQKRAEGLRILGGQSTAGGMPPRELTQEEKVRIGMQQYFKGSALEPILK